MAASTGPVLAIGAVTLANRVILHQMPMDWRLPIATGIAAGLFALLEKPLGPVAPAIAWLALATVILTRVDPAVPSPAESARIWFNASQTGK
jgi:hypothetical protein